jgi:hypothetical protein
MTNGNFVLFKHHEVVTCSKVVLRISYYIQLEKILSNPCVDNVKASSLQNQSCQGVCEV